MKKLLLMLAFSAITMAMWAQSDVMIATLQHGNTTSVFKGASAFVQAHNAAVDGDIITLSDGTFTATNISKSVTIYGAGFEQNAEKGTAITTINGNVYIGVADAILSGVKLEGLYITGTVFAANISNSTTAQLKNFTMKKCRVGGDLRFNSNIENVNILQCRIHGYVSGTKTVIANGLLIANCYIESRVHLFNTQSDVLLDHCIVGYAYNNGSSGADEMNNSAFTWTNCMMLWGGNYSNGRTTGRNCIVKNCMSSSFSTDIGNTYENCYSVNPGYIFADLNNASYTESRTFELASPDTYVGTDGTPVGPSGGLGWNKVPATPVVKSLDLEVNGNTLNVTYEAAARE